MRSAITVVVKHLVEVDGGHWLGCRSLLLRGAQNLLLLEVSEEGWRLVCIFSGAILLECARAVDTTLVDV